MPINYARLRNYPLEQRTQTYTERDTIIYALGVGAGIEDPLAASELKFVYEKALVALPTMAGVLAAGGDWQYDPSTGITAHKTLHGEQMLTVHKPLPIAATVTSDDTIDEIYDKGPKGAILYMTRRLREAGSGDLLATIGLTAFMRADGGFGGPSEGAPRPYPVPTDRPPDLTLNLRTRPEQALLYRLSGDYNPLHCDPEVAQSAGFPKPILHGMCTYGTAGRALLGLLCGNDPARLRKMNVRFSSPVFPGETIRTEIWREAAGRAAFRARVVERDVVAIDNGYCEYTI